MQSAPQSQGSGADQPKPCTFCEIVAGRLPARIFHDGDRFLVFQNQLQWVPVMLLVVPKSHMTQQEVWTSPSYLAEMGELAVRIGEIFCPQGYRLLSNFGRHALQSQMHAHLHVVGGTELGPYVVPRQWLTRR